MMKFKKCRGASMICILMLLIILLCVQSEAYAQAGELDSTFEVNGIKIRNFDYQPGDVYSDYVHELAIQSDGKIVAVGMTGLLTGIMRFNTNGTLDNTFGSQGKVQRIPGTWNSWLNSVAIQPDQKILTGGYMAVGVGPYFNENFCLMRFKPNGDNDSTFGINGLLNSDIGDSTEQLKSIALQSDGKIVAVGDTGPYGLSGNLDIALVRYQSNGILDSGFGNAGIVLTNIEYEDHAQKVLIQPDGKILVAGVSVDYFFPFEQKAFILRYLNNGQIDNTFGVQGQFNYKSNSFGCTDMVLQPDGKIVAVATLLDANDNYENSVFRLSTAGILDNSFGTGGMAKNTRCIEAGSEAVALQPDGKIVVAGQTVEDSLLGSMNFYVIRYKDQGAVDSTFGVNGLAEINITPNEGSSDVLLQTDGKIVVGGYTELPATSEDFVVMRFKNDLPSRVRDYTKDFKLKIYPNPTNGQFTIDYSKSLMEEINVKVFDITGKIIFSKSEIKGTYKTEITLDNGAGTYLLQIITSTGEKMFTQRIRVE